MVLNKRPTIYQQDLIIYFKGYHNDTATLKKHLNFHLREFATEKPSNFQPMIYNRIKIRLLPKS